MVWSVLIVRPAVAVAVAMTVVTGVIVVVAVMMTVVVAVTVVMGHLVIIMTVSSKPERRIVHARSAAIRVRVVMVAHTLARLVTRLITRLVVRLITVRRFASGHGLAHRGRLQVRSVVDRVVVRTTVVRSFVARGRTVLRRGVVSVRMTVVVLVRRRVVVRCWIVARLWRNTTLGFVGQSDGHRDETGTAYGYEKGAREGASEGDEGRRGKNTISRIKKGGLAPITSARSTAESRAWAVATERATACRRPARSLPPQAASSSAWACGAPWL